MTQKILIDNSVLQFSIAFKGEWQSSGIQYWGEALIDTGGIRSVLQSLSTKKISPQEGYIAALAKKFLKNEIEAYTTDALKFETYHQPSGRFRGINYGDISLLSKISPQQIKTLDGFSFSIPSDDVVEKLRTHINRSVEPDFLDIKNALPKKSSQDAWHLYCIQKHGLDVFLTMDFALMRQIRSIADKSLRERVEKIVRTPEDLCADFGISALGNDEIICFARNDLGVDPFFLAAPTVRKPAALNKLRDLLKSWYTKRHETI